MKKLFTYGLAICFYLLFVGGVAFGENINIVPYFFTGGDGDWWQYSYDETLSHPEPPIFNLNKTLLISGLYQGKYQIGDYAYPAGYSGNNSMIVDADATNLYIYWDNISGDIDPPTQVNGMVELNTLIDSPFSGNEGMKAYFATLPEYTVTAGTFSNILVYVVLDMAYERNNANDSLYNYIGLPTDIDYGVTHISLMALGIGEILNVDIDAETGDSLFEYQLAATSVPLPAAWLLFGSGIIGLIGVRKFF